MALFASRSRTCVFWSRLLPRSSAVSQRPQERNVAVRSQQFPEYSLIFDFEKIKAASRFNKMKTQATILTAAGTPLAILIQQMGFIIPNTVESFVFIGCGISLFFHSVGVLFNNTIGYIYLKDDGQAVKISYVGYWGQRVNVDTAIDKIQAFSDVPSGLISNPYYQRVRLMDSKKTFKMYIKESKILDKEIFTEIFGKIYR